MGKEKLQRVRIALKQKPKIWFGVEMGIKWQITHVLQWSRIAGKFDHGTWETQAT